MTDDTLRLALDGRLTAELDEVLAARGADVSADQLRALVRMVEPDNDEGRARAMVAIAACALGRDIEFDDTVERLVRFGLEAQPAPLELDGDASEEVLAEAEANVDAYSLGPPLLDEVAKLLLEYAPERALPVVRRSLRVGAAGISTAFHLAAIGTPWAFQEIEAAIPAAEPPNQVAYLAVITQLSGNDLATARARRTVIDSDAARLMGGFLESMMFERAQAAVAEFEPWAERVRAGLPDDFEP